MSRETRHDPLLVAGVIECGGHCDEKTYPIAAEWISDELLLVEWPAPRCAHGKAHVAITDPATLPTPLPPAPQCAETHGDWRCSRSPRHPNAQHCWQHAKSRRS